MLVPLAERTSLSRSPGTAALLLFVILSVLVVTPIRAHPKPSSLSLVETDDHYIVENPWYKACIWKEHRRWNEPNGLIEKLYLKKSDGDWSRNIVYSTGDPGYRLGYVEKASTYGAHWGGIVYWSVDINHIELDTDGDGLNDVVIVDAVGRKHGEIAGEPSGARNRNLWVFWADKPYFYGRHEKVYDEYDFGWNDQIAWMYDMAANGRVPNIFMTKETGDVVKIPYQFEGGKLANDISRILLPALLEKCRELPYIALESADGIVASLIVLDASTPLLEMTIVADSSIQEPQATFFSSQDYRRGSLELGGKTEYVEVLYYNTYGDISAVDNLCRELYSPDYAEEEMPSDVRAGSHYYYEKYLRFKWTGASLYGPYIGYSRSRYKHGEFFIDTSPQLDYPNFGAAYFMEDHYWAKEWMVLNGKRFEKLGVRSGYNGKKAWVEDFFSLDHSAMAVRHTLYNDSDKMVIDLQAGVGGGGILFREDFEDMDPRYYYHGVQYLECDSGIRIVDVGGDRGHVLHITGEGLANTGPLPPSFNVTFFVNMPIADKTLNDFFGIWGENWILRLRNDFGALKATSGESFVDTGVRIAPREWVKFTLSVDSAHYALCYNDQYVTRLPRRSTETPFRLMISGLNSRVAFDDISVVTATGPVSVSELVYYLEYNPRLAIEPHRLNATTFDLRFDDPAFGRVGMVVMAKGVSSMIDDGKGLSINLVDNPSPVTCTDKVVNATVIIWSHLGEINDVSEITPLHTRWPLTLRRHDISLRLPEFLRESSAITLSTPQPVAIEGNLTVTGSIEPRCPNAEVAIVYEKPDGSTFTRSVTSDAHGDFADVYTPDQIGNWTVRARWEGDYKYRGAESLPVSFAVVKASSSITCSALPFSLVIGESVGVRGVVSPARLGVPVTLTYTEPDGKALTRTVTTDAKGAFVDAYAPTSTGIGDVRASWEGDYKCRGAESLPVSFAVVKASSSITCSASPESITMGQSIMVAGSIEPKHDAVTVTLRYTKLGKGSVTRTVTTDATGAFRDSFSPDTADPWAVRASWEGDADNEGAISPSASFVVLKVVEVVEEVEEEVEEEVIEKRPISEWIQELWSREPLAFTPLALMLLALAFLAFAVYRRRRGRSMIVRFRPR